jgi:hypothetical protein
MLKSKKLRLKGIGQIIDLRDNLRGLCDFSIISSFKDDNGEIGFYELEYLTIERPEFKIDDEQFLPQKIDKAAGFTYKLKFYE